MYEFSNFDDHSLPSDYDVFSFDTEIRIVNAEDHAEPSEIVVDTSLIGAPDDRIDISPAPSDESAEKFSVGPINDAVQKENQVTAEERAEPNATLTSNRSIASASERPDEAAEQSPQPALVKTVGTAAVFESVNGPVSDDRGEQLEGSSELSETRLDYFAEVTNELGSESESNSEIEQGIQESDSPEPLSGGGDDLDPPDDIPEGGTAEGDDDPDPLSEIITNDQGEFLGFRQPFDGNQPEISPDEQDAVKDAFRSFVRDTIEANDDSASLPYTPAEKFVNKYHTTVDGKEVAVMMGQRRVNLQGVLEYDIHIQELQEGEWAGEGSRWIQYGEDPVVRHDSELPPWAEQELSIIQGSGTVIHEYSYDPNDRANLALAVALGFNDQPISMVEARSLFEVTERIMAQRRARRGQ